MARKNRTPEENAHREKIRELLQMANIGSMDDIQNLFKETIAENLWKMVWRPSWTISWATAGTTTKTRTRTTAATVTAIKHCGPALVMWRCPCHGIEKAIEPKVLKKNQTSVSQDIEEKILSMYAKGMTTSDIEAHIQDIYGVEVSDTAVSRITDKILPIAKEWQQRPLEAVYAVVFLDVIHYHVRSEGWSYVKKKYKLNMNFSPQ